MLPAFLSWDRFLTPTIAKWYYFGLLVLIALGVLSSIVTGITLMIHLSIFGGLFTILFAFVGGAIGVLLARMSAELILIIFRISDTLTEIRNK